MFKSLLGRLPRMLLIYFAGMGILDTIGGIPFVGRLAANVLDGIAYGAEELAEVIRYASLEEAQEDVSYMLGNGARLEGFYNNSDGTVAAKYDVSGYSETN